MAADRHVSLEQMSKDTIDRLAAGAFFAAHCGFVLFALFGGLLVYVNESWLWIHVPVVLWIFIMNLASWTCPLTTWEKAFRVRAGEAYDGGFVQHYLGPVVNPKGGARRLEIIVGGSILIWNALLYTVIFGYLRR